MNSHATARSSKQGDRPTGRGVAILHGLLTPIAAGIVALTAGSAQWRPWPLAVIATFTVISDLTSVDTGSAKVKLSGCLVGVVVAAVLLGGGPAALVGVVTIAIGWLRWREPGHYLRSNLATYAWFPLVTGLAFHAAVGVADARPDSVAYYLFVFAAFVLALALNFLAIAGYQCYLDGSSLTLKARDALAPVLAAELFSALLTMAAVYVAVK